MKVYIVNWDLGGFPEEAVPSQSFNKKLFKEIAHKQKTVFTLKEFQSKFNYSGYNIHPNVSYILIE